MKLWDYCWAIIFRQPSLWMTQTLSDSPFGQKMEVILVSFAVLIPQMWEESTGYSRLSRKELCVYEERNTKLFQCNHLAKIIFWKSFEFFDGSSHSLIVPLTPLPSKEKTAEKVKGKAMVLREKTFSYLSFSLSFFLSSSFTMTIK